MNLNPTPELDDRFSAPGAGPTPWSVTAQALQRAELYWLTTVRADGRPHVTPLIAIAGDDALYFTTGLGEQKAHNLRHNDHVALTTGSNSWASGLDVVVEGRASRLEDREELTRLAAAYEAKYGAEWSWEVTDDGMFRSGPHEAAVFRIEPRKVLAFAKDPHAQTRYRL
jgi:general stress protein 26